MCTRSYEDRKVIESWRSKYGIRQARRMWDERQGGNLYPGYTGGIALPIDGQLTLVDATWGLQPLWSDDPKYGLRMYNARNDSLDKPTWRTPFRKGQRCLIPVAAFYEQANGRWLKIQAADGEAVAIAGLYERAHELSPLPSYAMVTTDPNALIGEVHDRMPVVLAPEDYDAWLDPQTPREDLLALLTPAPGELLTIEDAGPNRRTSGKPSLFD